MVEKPSVEFQMVEMSKFTNVLTIREVRFVRSKFT